MTQAFTRLELSEAQRQSMLAHVHACLPNEGCGLVSGFLQDGSARATAIITVENELRSPVRFRMAPAEQLKALLWIESQGQELLAIFHSHPAGPDHPSETDLAEFAYPESCMLICSPDRRSVDRRSLEQQWQVRAFHVDGVLSPQSTWSETPLVMLSSAPTNPSSPSHTANDQEGL